MFRLAGPTGIYGGTLEVFRNMIAQHALGLGKPNYSPPVQQRLKPGDHLVEAEWREELWRKSTLGALTALLNASVDLEEYWTQESGTDLVRASLQTAQEFRPTPGRG